MTMSSRIYSSHGQALIELALLLPLVLVMCLGGIEFSNILKSYTILTHLTRESANVISRETDVIGTTSWASSVNADLTTVIDAATPVVNRNGSGATGPSQFKIYYSQVEWNAAAAICDYNINNSLGTGCLGNIGNGTPDRYRIRRTNAGWAGTISWQYGLMSASSQIGADGSCACSSLPQVKQLSTQGLTLHVIEVFYNYQPSRITRIENLLGGSIFGSFYRRSVFMGMT